MTTLNQENMNATILGQHAESMAYDFRREALWSWLARHIPSQARTLDAGCGTGYFTLQLARQGNPTLAIEHDDTLTSFAQKLLAREGLSVEVRRMALGTGQIRALGQYERVICMDVLEHIEDDAAAIADLREALTPDGLLLISVPSMPALYGERDRFIGHFRRYSPASLRALAEGAGLRLVEGPRYWNALGVIPYLFYEKLLGQPINDDLRKPSKSALKRTIGRGICAWLKAETHLFLPFGLSLLLVCRR
ncbi:MAG: class I SAM-dependent methyltransferase [Anaerolineae bacterium]|nr:class I SAM-dependent methyltransferase [Anaerolineae bacterium]MDW8171546.1 class I SAM-dependent methyltransferase [Anaerolineae bacterium]